MTEHEINAILSGITDSRQKTVCSYAVSYTHLDAFMEMYGVEAISKEYL